MQWKITTAFYYHHHESRHPGRTINAQPLTLMLYADRSQSDSPDSYDFACD